MMGCCWAAWVAAAEGAEEAVPAAGVEVAAGAAALAVAVVAAAPSAAPASVDALAALGFSGYVCQLKVSFRQTAASRHREQRR